MSDEFKKVDAPIKFEGQLYVVTRDGLVVEATVVFGYGSVPTARQINELIGNVMEMIDRSHGGKCRLPTPTEFMQIGIEREYGKRVATVDTIMDSRYDMVEDKYQGA